MPNKKRQENLRAPQAFEAISRHMSFSKAAEEIDVSQSAFSHQVRGWTEEIG